MKNCPHCFGTIDPQNINYLLTIEFTEGIKENPEDKEFYLFMHQGLCKAKGINYCICLESLEERKSYIKEAEKILNEKNHNHEIQLKQLGYDFASNQDVLYVRNEYCFDPALLLQSLKKTKHTLSNSEYLTFDYISSSTTLEEGFNRNKYFIGSQFLFIDFDFIDVDKKDRRKMLSDISEIITERRSNLRKTFILLPKDVNKEKFDSMIKKEIFSNEINVVDKFIKTVDSFQEKMISTNFDQDSKEVQVSSSELYVGKNHLTSQEVTNQNLIDGLKEEIVKNNEISLIDLINEDLPESF